MRQNVRHPEVLQIVEGIGFIIVYALVGRVRAFVIDEVSNLFLQGHDIRPENLALFDGFGLNETELQIRELLMEEVVVEGGIVVPQIEEPLPAGSEGLGAGDVNAVKKVGFPSLHMKVSAVGGYDLLPETLLNQCKSLISNDSVNVEPAAGSFAVLANQNEDGSGIPVDHILCLERHTQGIRESHASATEAADGVVYITVISETCQSMGDLRHHDHLKLAVAAADNGPRAAGQGMGRLLHEPGEVGRLARSAAPHVHVDRGLMQDAEQLRTVGCE